MSDLDLRGHVIGSYTATRIGVAALGIALPLALWLGGMRSDLPLQTSMSAYYHAGDGAMRDWFVGILFAVGVILLLYRGYSDFEDLALDVAGLAVVGVALVPMEWECGANCASFSLHGALALTFFGALAYVCIFRASDTVELIEEQKTEGSAERAQRYRVLYRLFGVSLILSPLIAWGLSAALDPASPRRFWIFAAEAAGVVVFSLYWIAKSREIRQTHADGLAAMDLLTRPKATLLEPAPVELRSLASPTEKAGG